MALSPNDQALTPEEVAFADKLEKDIDQKLSVMAAVMVLVLEMNLYHIPEKQRHRVKSEIVRRYLAVGWSAADWKSDGFKLTRKSP